MNPLYLYSLVEYLPVPRLEAVVSEVAGDGLQEHAKHLSVV